MEPKFKAGDTVTLRSGGPPMTVESFDGTKVTCIWFDDNTRLARDTFRHETLEKAAN